ncbi:MAG: nuclear transport factor 2 family protein [Magnetovibrio sp.]|nr:nuclear transport factor 2 family protein [Magnetovibrio sp.]
MSRDAAVLFANDAFYLAFATRDMAAMDDIWARRAAVSCLHPGWAPLTGRDAVMESWRGILGSPDSPQISCANAQATVIGDVAVVVCGEILAQGTLAATNVFAFEDGAWKMVHHHAAPAPPPETAAAGDDAPPTLQ